MYSSAKNCDHSTPLPANRSRSGVSGLDPRGSALKILIEPLYSAIPCGRQVGSISIAGHMARGIVMSMIKLEFADISK